MKNPSDNWEELRLKSLRVGRQFRPQDSLPES